MSRFGLSPQAKVDLETNASYIGARNPSAAVRELEKLLDRFSLLASNALLGQLRPELPGSPRSFAAGAFIILYKPTADGIEVARVVHAARDIGSILREE